MNTIGKRIEELAKLRGLSLRAVCRMAGISPTVLSYHARKGTTPRKSTLAAIASALDVTPQALESDDLLLQEASRKDDNAASTAVPLVTDEAIAKLADGIAVTADGDNRIDEWIPELPFVAWKGESLIAYQVRGSALAPTVNDGDVVYFTTDTIAADGDIVVAMCSTNSPLVRRLVMGDTGRSWLKATNVDYPGDKLVPCECIVGVVVAKASQLKYRHATVAGKRPEPDKK